MFKDKYKKIIASVLCVVFALALVGCTKEPTASQDLQQVADNMQEDEKNSPDVQPVANTGNNYSAMWISYLEFEQMDFSSQETFTQQIKLIFDNCKKINLNTVIVQVRPFGDALYNSSIFPTSHISAGTQGGEMTFDPLAIMVKEAHERGLKIEAWVNPYRVALTEEKPGTLADTNPAVKFMADEKTADYVFNANNGTYYNPAVLEVQQLITDGVVEIVKNYEVDGIQFDDYFYPEGADSTFDEGRYALDSREISLEDWRRDNVNSLIKKVYAAIKAEKPSVVFGISPQGNNDNNYNLQYSDVGLWLSTDGYVDYIMPQVYWGYNFVLKSGNDRFSYKNCLAEWLAMPKSENVKLYIGLGAFRLGNGDGSSVASDEWQSGANLGAMIKDLKSAGADGYALYRYDSLFNNPEFASLAESEATTIATENLN